MSTITINCKLTIHKNNSITDTMKAMAEHIDECSKEWDCTFRQAARQMIIASREDISLRSK